MPQRKLVHKQFNSPMGLYSAQNVRETLNRELNAFGNEGIEVDEEIKRNLSKSAVYQAVAEEENYHNSPFKRVAWPPKSEQRPFVREFTPQPQRFNQQSNQQGGGDAQVQFSNQQQHLANAQSRFLSPTPPRESYTQSQFQRQYSGPSAVSNPRPQPVQTQQQQHYQPQPQQQQQPQTYNQPRQQQHQQQYQQQQHQQPAISTSDIHIEAPSYNPNLPNHRWQHVKNPVPVSSGYVNLLQRQQQQAVAPPFATGSWHGQANSAPAYGNSYQSNAGASSHGYHQNDQQQRQNLFHTQNNSSSLDQVDTNRQNYRRHYSQPPPQQQQQQQPYHQHQQTLNQNQYSDYSQGYNNRGQSPGVIQLRKEAPFNQRPSPVYQAQPAATGYQGGNNISGDVKWPPQEYKQSVIGNLERRRIAQGPVCRPRRNRDFTDFLYKNNVNNFQSGYRVPPGTQHVSCQY